MAVRLKFNGFSSSEAQVNKQKYPGWNVSTFHDQSTLMSPFIVLK